MGVCDGDICCESPNGDLKLFKSPAPRAGSSNSSGCAASMDDLFPSVPCQQAEPQIRFFVAGARRRRTAEASGRVGGQPPASGTSHRYIVMAFGYLSSQIGTTPRHSPSAYSRGFLREKKSALAPMALAARSVACKHAYIVMAYIVMAYIRCGLSARSVACKHSYMHV